MAEKLGDRIRENNEIRSADAKTVEGRLVIKSNEIATIIDDIVAQSESFSKKDMIVSSQRVNTEVEALQKIMDELSAKCSSVRDQEQIISKSVKCKKTAVNLKINTAMRAATATEKADEMKKTEEKLRASCESLADDICEAVDTIDLTLLNWNTK
eukprot:TRINITY_DN13285_c0_g1_i1.p1 TRINITY_DN13285_c0_g1~~TRINITY_DN13285_c0_g1_i1.p1  ORF type:complete len:155 (-),score=47.75 TRINITY_DN13285_c0_g1_i1:88-552(-)